MYDERRKFRRYKSESEFPLKVGSKRYTCRAIDYSADGICLQFVDEIPQIEIGSVIEIKIEDPEIELSGELKWVRETGGGLLAGFQRVDAIKGSCHAFRLPDLLLGIQRLKKTGTLEIIYGPKLMKIFFRNGDMIFAQSNQEDDRFGEVLLKKGDITLEQYFEASETLEETGKRLGTILIELGYLEPDKLVGTVRHQVVEIIYNVLTTDCGYFVFNESPLTTKEAITLNLSAANLIYRGIKRVDNFQYIVQDFPRIDSVLTLAEDPLDLFQDITLDKQGKDILSRIDGKTTIKEILSPAMMNDFEAIKTLYALLSARIIMIRRFDEPPPVVTSEEVITEPLAEIDAEFTRMIGDKYESCRSSTYYEILGVKTTDSTQDIKKAYFKMAKEFHPDRHFSVHAEDIKQKLNDISSYINVAYNALSDTEKRREYDEKISNRPAGSAPGAPESSEVAANEAFDEGRSRMTLGQYEEAEQLFARAIYLKGDLAIYSYYHGLVLNKLGMVKEAARAVEKAVELMPANADYCSELGYLYLELGFKKRAEGAFKKALDVDPLHEKAVIGLQKSFA